MGSLRVLVVSARFAEEAAQNTSPPDYANQLFDPELPGSFSHFYRTMSFGQLEVAGRVLPRRYSSDLPAVHYVSTVPGEEGQFGAFAREILLQVDGDVDLRQFDNDGPDGVPDSGDDDGVVDYVFINALSIPPHFLIGSATGVGSLGLKEAYVSRDIGANGDPIRIAGHGSIQEEGTFAQTVGAMAHEFGHHLGLPDLYDLKRDAPEEDSAGIGCWGLMGWGAHGWHGDDGPNPFCAWSLEELGWIRADNERLVEVTGDTAGLVLADLHANGFVGRVPLRATLVEGATIQEEYLLLEQRTRTGTFYNRHLPGEGLLVWHVRPVSSSHNDDEQAKQVDLVCADGLYRDAGYPRGGIPDRMRGGDNLDFWSHDPAYAADHAGNMGDGTDPFDGLRLARLGRGTNPANNPQGITSAACRGTELTMHPRGETMAVDVRQPRWAGRIGGPVCWAGTVLVDGDLEVSRDGKLVLQKGTQVLFEGADRLRSGEDPELCELAIEGNLHLRSNPREKVIFRARQSGGRWYGILLSPADSCRVHVPKDGYELRDSEHGLTFPSLPAHTRGKLWFGCQLVDTPGPETAGNGDGQLSPGESFQWIGELVDGTLTSYINNEAWLRWDTSLVYPTWDHQVDLRNALVVSSGLSVGPGGRRVFAWPSLTLSPEAQAGQRVEFTLEMANRHWQGTESWPQPETLSFVVAGSYPTHQAEFEISGYEVRNRSALIPADRPVAIQVRIEGQVSTADLVVRSPLKGIPIVEIPMVWQSTEGTTKSFEGVFTPPGSGLYEASLRVRGPDGGAAFSDVGLHLLGTATPRPPPALVFMGEHYGEKQQERLAQAMSEALAEWGLATHILPEAPTAGTLYHSLAAHFAGAGSVIIWLGRTMEEEAMAAFSRFLEQGGRLLLISAELNRSARSAEFLETMLCVERVPHRSSGPLRCLSCIPPAQLDATSWQLELVSPAEPMLLDEEGRPAGLRVNTGTYRAVYLPLNLARADTSEYGPLLESSLAFLQQEEVGEVVLEAAGKQHAGEGFVFDTEEALSVRARVEGAVSRVQLVVWSLPDRERLLVQEMRRAQQQVAGGVYECALTLADPGQYQLSLQLHTAQARVLSSSTSIRGVGYAARRPVLVMLGAQYSAAEKQKLRMDFARALGTWGLEANFVDLVDEDGSFFGALLNDHLGEGTLVVWLGGRMDSQAQEAFRSFFDRGGKAVLGSLKLFASSEIGPFLQEILHTGQEASTATSGITSAGSLAGLQLEFWCHYAHYAELGPLAEPILLDKRGKPAGIRVDTDTRRLVFLPFDLGKIEEPARQLLIEAGLSLIRQEMAGAELLVPQHERGGQGMVVEPGASVPVQAAVADQVEQVDLLIRSAPQLESVAVKSMRRIAARDSVSLYAGDFELPAPGEYELSLRLRRADGVLLGNAARLRVFGFDTGAPILVLVGSHYKPTETEWIRVQLAGAFEGMGQRATFVDGVEEEEAYLTDLLDQYLDPGDLVIWLGSRMGEGSQADFRDFVHRGGRLLVVSQSLHLSTGIEPFVQEVFHTERLYGWKRTTISPTEALSDFPRAFSVDHVPLPSLRPPAEPLFLDEKGAIAGLWVEADAYRLAYLAFDLRNVDAGLISPLLGGVLPFLLERSVPEPSLHLRTVIAPDTLAPLQPVVPQVLVANSGSHPATEWRIGYQILQGGEPVGAAAQEEGYLEAHSTKAVALPPWEPAEEGDYRIRFGLSHSAEEELIYGDGLPLRLVNVPAAFEQVDLPGELSGGNGAGFFDFDSDGDLDAYLVRVTKGAANQLFRNDGGVLVEQAEAAGLADTGEGRGLAIGDLEGDGDLDLYLVNDGTNRLFRNEGNGTFAPITDQLGPEGRGLGDEGAGRSAAFWDFDRDGDLDLYLVNAAGANRLFRNDGDAMVEAARERGLADEGNGRGLGLGDHDSDGDTDLFVANTSGGSRFFRNDAGHFADVHQELGMAFFGGEVAGAFGDCDNDGDLDLFVSSERAMNQLFRNEGGQSFQPVIGSGDSHLGASTVGTAFLDYDNDGDLDLATTAVSPASGGDELYLNRGRDWVPVGRLLGLRGESRGRGLSAADYDQDGYQDLLVADSDESCLYRNQTGRSHWLAVELTGTGANRQALGARIELAVGEQRQLREVQVGSGYCSQKPSWAHFGMGTATRAEELRVRWPDGRETVWEGIPSDQRLTLTHPVFTTGVAEDLRAHPAAFCLRGNHPNPFNHSTIVRYSVPQNDGVELAIYNLAGQRVTTLVRGPHTAGDHAIPWNGTDAEGRLLATGLYLCRLQAGKQVATHKTLLLR